MQSMQRKSENEQNNKGMDFSVANKTEYLRRANQGLVEVPKTELCSIDIQNKGNVHE